MQLVKRAFLLLILLAGLCALCPAQDGKAANDSPPPAALEYNTNNWETFLSPNTGFSVSMPGKPVSTTQTVDSPFGQVTQNNYRINTDTGGYLVSYLELPGIMDDATSIKTVLNMGRDSLLARHKGMKVLSEREVKVEGYTGAELLVRDGDSILHARNFIAGSRFYQLLLSVTRQTAFKSGKPSSKPSDLTDFYQLIAAKFFDSFHLMNGGTIAPVATGGQQKIVRVGILNGKALRIPQPEYPAAAKAAHAQGTVVVHVVIDEEGKVIEAKALSGHPLLRPGAERAALGARFTPVKLQGTPVRIEGVINFNFSL